MDYELEPETASNPGKHRIDFADPAGVLEDEWALTIREEYAEGEQRFATLGTDFLERLLVVVYTYRGGDIRLISARGATRKQGRAYERKRV